MLYHLLDPFRTQVLGAERGALHHVPHGGGEPVGAGDQPGARAVDDPQAARVPDRSGDSPGRSDQPSRQGRHADDGRAADPDRRARADAALGRPDERLRLDRGPDDGGVRRDRLRRRLPEDRPARPSRPVAALQDGLADADRARRRHRAARARAAGPLQHPADLSVLQVAHPGSRLVVRAVRDVRAAWLVERRQPDRRAGRSGDQHVRDRRGDVHGAGLRHRSSRVRRLPAARPLRAGGGADGLLRRAGRRVARVPLVQLVPGGDLHGRRRIAGARRRARHRRDPDQAGAAAR